MPNRKLTAGSLEAAGKLSSKVGTKWTSTVEDSSKNMVLLVVGTTMNLGTRRAFHQTCNILSSPGNGWMMTDP